RGFELRERLFVGCAAVGVELSEAAPVKVLKVGIGAGERQINVVEHTRVTPTGLAGGPGHQAFRECGNRGALLIIEECAMLNRGGMRLTGSGSVLMLLECLSVNVGDEPRAGDGSGAHGGALQK